MGIEIERKFLVKSDFQDFAINSEKIVQGYLSSVPERNVRVRIKGDKAFLTIKGIGNETNISRYEWETEISLAEGYDLLKLCENEIIDKMRFYIPEKSGLLFEVDVFYGKNEGLIICEIELPDENYKFIKPEWLGKEITDDLRYYNSCLVKLPFKSWSDHQGA